MTRHTTSLLRLLRTKAVGTRSIPSVTRLAKNGTWWNASLPGILFLLLLTAVPCATAGTKALREIVVVFKTHFDIGYTDMASNIVQRYRTTMMDKALEVVDQNRDLPPEQQFVWTVSGWPMHKILQDWPGQSPQRKERVERALREGRFVVHGLPFSTHTELLEAEEIGRASCRERV